MSSILSATIRKTYKPITDLQEQNVVDVYYLNDAFCKGTIHTIYAKIDCNDYKKLYDFYNQDGSLSIHKHLMYSNNAIGVLCYSKTMYGQHYCETWEFIDSEVYSYDEVDVAYVMDRFKKRKVVTLDNLNHVSLRYNSSGNWCNLDNKITMFLGKRILYNSFHPNIQYIKYKDRTQNSAINLQRELGGKLPPMATMDVTEDYYVMFRLINHNDFKFSLLDIKKLLESQKLRHLVDPDINLMETIR